MNPQALARVLAWVATNAPKGIVGTLGYALSLLAAASWMLGSLARAGTVHVADCSGAALDATLQTVALGQASSAVLVLLVAVAMQRKGARPVVPVSGQPEAGNDPEPPVSSSSTPPTGET